MNDLEKAIEAESQQKLTEAADLYEKIISEQPKPPLEAFINLMFLYFETQDYGIEYKYNISLEYVTQAYDRIAPLYKQAKTLKERYLQGWIGDGMSGSYTN